MPEEIKKEQLEVLKKIEDLILEMRKMGQGSFDYHTQGRTIDPLILEAEKIKRLAQIKEWTSKLEL